MEPIDPLTVQPTGPLISLAFIAVGVAVLALFVRRFVGRLLTLVRTDERPVEDIESDEHLYYRDYIYDFSTLGEQPSYAGAGSPYDDSQSYVSDAGDFLQPVQETNYV